MTIEERKGDLFSADSSYYLAHCISSDFKLGAGVAKEFNSRGTRKELLDNYLPRWQEIGYCNITHLSGYEGCCNLVTKHRYFDKPTYKTLKESLLDMKWQIPKDAKLAMPKIGCGLDKLSWENVKPMIEEVFSDTDIEIVVYYLY